MKPQKTKAVKKFLKSQGWEFLRDGKGSHELWGNPQTGHGEVSPGVLRQLEAVLPNVPREWK